MKEKEQEPMFDMNSEEAGAQIEKALQKIYLRLRHAELELDGGSGLTNLRAVVETLKKLKVELNKRGIEFEEWC